MIILIMSFAAASSIAAPENSLSVNGGYSHTWIELEYEMKTDPFAYGAKLGLGYYAFEVGGFFRYYYGLNSLLNIPAEYRLSVFGGITPSFLLGTWYYDGVGFLMDDCKSDKSLSIAQLQKCIILAWRLLPILEDFQHEVYFNALKCS